METENFVVECTMCKRKMLVTQILFSANHTADISVTCPDCIPKMDWSTDEWIKRNPEEAKELRKILKRD